MPAYYFHIIFELYPRCSPDSAFTPSPATDIFCSALPVHQTASWTCSAPAAASLHDIALSARPQWPSATVRVGQRARSSFSDHHHHHHHHHHDSPVPIVKPSKKPDNQRIQSPAHRDWRFDAISILSIDMSPALGHAPLTSSTGGLAIKGNFVPADPTNTELGWGVIHLYRDGQETPDLYHDADIAGGAFNPHDCTTLCILAVPSYMTPSDLLGFMGEQTREHVSHFRLIRTSRANKYMVLMKFRDTFQARRWRKEWDGKAFNSMEPEYCHVVFVKSINFQHDDCNHDPTSYPDLTNDPFAPAPAKQPTAPLPPTSATSSSAEGSSLASALTVKPHAPPTPALIELPTCPVCLERMDETTGLLTILCQHVFHCACLEKWRGSGCPVCRYTQNDVAAMHRGAGGAVSDNACSACGSAQNLWICLICGNIGCGRYDSAHAFAHYETTSHTYAMDVVTQHVWDYMGDGYVHRLIQNKTDGKLVDMPASTQTGQSLSMPGMTGYANDAVPREKLDNMGVEYAYLLTSQLESQRAYFEEQLERAVDKAAKAASSADEAGRAVTSLSQKLDELSIQHREAKVVISSLEKESTRHAQKATSASELARSFNKQYKEEQTMNESLMERIKHLEKRISQANERIVEVETQKADLEEQNRDLSFFISGQEKLKEMQGNEVMGLQDGEVEAAVVEVGKGRRRGKKKT